MYKYRLFKIQMVLYVSWWTGINTGDCCFKMFCKCAQQGHQKKRCPLNATRIISCWLPNFILWHTKQFYSSPTFKYCNTEFIYTLNQEDCIQKVHIMIKSSQEYHINLWHIQERRRKNVCYKYLGVSLPSITLR